MSIPRKLTCTIFICTAFLSCFYAQSSLAQIRQLPPVDFGLVGGMALSSGNPSLRSAATFLEGYTEIPIAGPFSAMLTAGAIFSEKKSDAAFNIRVYDAGVALKVKLPLRLGAARPFVAVGPSIFYFDPVGSVDSEDALLKAGFHVHLGLTYSLSEHFKLKTIGRVGFTSTDVGQFPLSLPRGSSSLSIQSYLGMGLFFRI